MGGSCGTDGEQAGVWEGKGVGMGKVEYLPLGSLEMTPHGRGNIHVEGGKIVVSLHLLSRFCADTERWEASHGISPDRVLGEDE